MSTIRIPLAALAIDDTQPQAGDPVDATIAGKVESLDGDTAVVTVDTINGVPAPAESAAPLTGDADEDDLRRQAASADGLPYDTP